MSFEDFFKIWDKLSSIEPDFNEFKKDQLISTKHFPELNKQHMLI